MLREYKGNNAGNIPSSTPLTHTNTPHTLRDSKGRSPQERINIGNGKSGALLGAGPGQSRGSSSTTQLQIGRYSAAFGESELQYDRDFPPLHST